jgi:RecB family exonuclease
VSGSALPEAWSYSALNQLLRICGAQFFFERVAGMEPSELSPAPILGSSLHHAHAFARVRQMRGEPIVLDDLRDVFSESFLALTEDERVVLDQGEREQLRADGLAYVELLAAHLGDERVVAVEHEFLVPIEHAGERLARPLRGFIDLIVIDHEGRTVFVDLKTAATKYTRAKLDNDLQATAYSYAASKLYPGGAGFRFDVVTKRTRPSFERYFVERTEADFARLFALVKTAERMIAAGAFIPADGSYFCGGCGHRAACRAWAEHLGLASGNPLAASAAA